MAEGHCFIQTYIIGHYNPSVRIIALVSHNIMLCVLILYVSGGTYSLNSSPNDGVFEKLFMEISYLLIYLNRPKNTFWGLEPCLYV